MQGLLQYMQQTALMAVATVHIGKNKRSNFRIMNPSFATVVGLVWSVERESCAGGSIATGRASHATQVQSDNSNKKAYPDPPGWVWTWGNNATPQKINCYRTHKGSHSPPKAVVLLLLMMMMIVYLLCVLYYSISQKSYNFVHTLCNCR